MFMYKSQKKVLNDENTSILQKNNVNEFIIDYNIDFTQKETEKEEKKVRYMSDIKKYKEKMEVLR